MGALMIYRYGLGYPLCTGNADWFGPSVRVWMLLLSNPPVGDADNDNGPDAA